MRPDGNVFGFTDHDKRLTIDGVHYTPTNGISVTSITTSSGLNVDNLEMMGFVALVSESEIQAGRWDHSDVRVFEVNWANPALGINRLKRGILGDITLEDKALRCEVRGLTQYLIAAVGETTSKFCKADLFDDRCKVPETEGVYKFSAVAVTSIASNRTFAFSSVVQASDFFTNGKVLGVAGLNAGIVREIKLHTSGSPAGAALIELFEQMPYDIFLGDTFTLYAGCQKRYEEDCIDKFDNGINFRGFPHLPGPDKALEGPE